MIHKVERLISIGKFRNYNASGDVAFKKLTLFYADNGGGKTTLTSILRSLTHNLPEIISRRLSTNHTNPQSAQIIQRTISGDTHHTFNPASGWTVPLSDVEIFDIHFVNENIYSGFEFSDYHKKQLHQFVIGAQSIAIQQQMDQNRTDKVLSRQRQDQLQQQILQQVGNNLTADQINSFLSISLTEAHNVDSEISVAETILRAANANSVIQTLQPLATADIINSGINFAQIISDLNSTSQTLQNRALETLFNAHCQELSNNSLQSPTNWLHWGQIYIESKRQKGESLECPFCRQAIGSSLDIISAYAQQFNAEFNALIERLRNHLTSLQAFNIDSFTSSLNSLSQENTARISNWSSHLSNVAAPNGSLITDENTLRAELTALLQTIQLKIQNPSIAVPSQPAVAFESSLNSINQNIVSYNTIVATYNGAIEIFRRSIRTSAQAQLELERLRRIKRRFEVPISTLCNDLVGERQRLRTLEAAYTTLAHNQLAAATTFFGSYQTSINHYLGTVFKTPFRIEDVVHIAPRGLATQNKIGYKLTIDGQDVSFDFNQTRNAKDSLSEGDKSTIALAFFLSKLDVESSIANKILIFDDPLSSFDSNRRMYTIQLIKELFPRIRQVIVLSHNEFFLHELSKGFSASEKKVLRINTNFTTQASHIEELNLESLVEIDYFKHIKELENFLSTPDILKKEHILGLLRNVLESHIRFKFYRQLSGLSGNNQTFGNLITTLVNQNVIFRDNINRATIIAKLNLINAISCRPHHGEPIPDYGALGANPNSMNITELANFVTDTLNLVDNEI